MLTIMGAVHSSGFFGSRFLSFIALIIIRIILLVGYG